MEFDRLKMIEALRRVVQRMHYPLEVMLVCVRWYAAYPLSFRLELTDAQLFTEMERENRERQDLSPWEQ